MREVSLFNLNYKDLTQYPPEVAVLPWGATEAHNFHLPYCTDVVEAHELALKSAKFAAEKCCEVVVLPPIPFGSNAQQLEQFCTIHLSAETIKGILRDVVYSLKQQGIEKLLILNFHGGNEFKPFVRDILDEFKILIVVINAWKMIPEVVDEIFTEPGDHGGELETSIMMYLRPEDVKPDDAGNGETIPFELTKLKQPGVWSPRPWNSTHPDTGAGDPSEATAEKGELYFHKLSEAIAGVIKQMSEAERGMLPFV